MADKEGGIKRPHDSDSGQEDSDDARVSKKARLQSHDEDLYASDSDHDQNVNARNDNNSSDSGDREVDSDDDDIEVDPEFLALSEKEKFQLWLKEEKEEGTAPEDLFEMMGIEDIVPLLNLELKEDLWKFWELLADEDDPMQEIRDMVDEIEEAANSRKKLEHINSHEDVIELIKKAKKIVVITGAGISVSCGVPDFRSPGGLYDQVSAKFALDDPHKLFDIHFLRENPNPFFEFAKQLFPGDELQPSPSHRFIKALEERSQLLRHYTQNIDTLERRAGIANSIQCHGSFNSASCILCKDKVDGSVIRAQIMESKIPMCTKCNDGKSFYKPDIVFFGEPLPADFHERILKDCESCDLLIVMGSSMRVQPVSSIPRALLILKQLSTRLNGLYIGHLGKLRPGVPQILINKQNVMQPHQWDYFYEGSSDEAVAKIAQSLGINID